MAVVLTNNASSRLSASLTAGATSLSVTSGEGAKFPSVASGSGDWFPLTLIKASGALEIVRCTARSGDVFTVTRSQEGSSAQSFSPGDRVELRMTAAAFNDPIIILTQSVSTLRSDALLKADNLSGLSSPSAARSNLGLGSAATATVTTSANDTTAGRLTKVGDFGLGGPSLVDTNANTSRPSGSYGFNGGTNTPTPSVNVISLDWGPDPTWQVQIAQAVAANDLWIRCIRKDQSSATGWAKLFGTHNVSAYVQTLLDDADAAAARTTLGLGTIATLSHRQAANAWCNFQGSGVVTLRDTYNVSSVGDLGVGTYRVNFATPLDNSAFCPIGMASNDSSSNYARVAQLGNPTNSYVDLVVTNGIASGVTDSPYVLVAVFGGKP